MTHMCARPLSHPRFHRAFSLIELSTAVAIMGILAAIALPTYLGHLNNARDKVSQTALVAVAEDARSLTVVNQGYFPPFSSTGSGNLVENGFGEAGDLTNWSGWNGFHPAAVPVADYGDQVVQGYFQRDSGNTSPRNNVLIPVSPDLTYHIQAYAKDDSSGSGYLLLISYDADGNQIGVNMILRQPGSATTTLTQDLHPGDTEVHLADATGWHPGTGTHYAQIALWPYVSPTVGAYEPYTYSRNVAKGPGPGADPIHSYNLWGPGGIVGNTITLLRPWDYTNPNRDDGVWPAGTPVANHRYGGTYSYQDSDVLPTTWLKQERVIHGTGTGMGHIWPGTSYVKVGALTTGSPENMDYAGFVFEQIDPQDPDASIQEWSIPPYDLVSVQSTHPAQISVAPASTDDTAMLYASLSDTGTCWIVVDDLIGGRRFGRIDDGASQCWATLIDPATITASSFADA